jgi:hypothetical protein
LTPFSAYDLLGQPHRSSELVGRGTLVIAITDRDGSSAMRAWYSAADRRAPASTRRISLLALDLPFYVSAGLARRVARGEVPQQYWHQTWLDRHGALARTLGLEKTTAPYVFALDAQGRVVASAHGQVDRVDARAIWSALAR